MLPRSIGSNRIITHGLRRIDFNYRSFIVPVLPIASAFLLSRSNVSLFPISENMHRTSFVVAVHVILVIHDAVICPNKRLTTSGENVRTYRNLEIRKSLFLYLKRNLVLAVVSVVRYFSTPLSHDIISFTNLSRRYQGRSLKIFFWKKLLSWTYLWVCLFFFFFPQGNRGTIKGLFFWQKKFVRTKRPPACVGGCAWIDRQLEFWLIN